MQERSELKQCHDANGPRMISTITLLLECLHAGDETYLISGGLGGQYIVYILCNLVLYQYNVKICTFIQFGNILYIYIDLI